MGNEDVCQQSVGWEDVRNAERTRMKVCWYLVFADYRLHIDNSAHQEAQGLRPSYDSKRVEASKVRSFFQGFQMLHNEVVCESHHEVEGTNLPFLTGQELCMHK